MPPSSSPAPTPRTLTSVDDHAARVGALLPRPGPADVPLADCDGLILAADLIAKVALPGFDNSAMDGYAVRRAEVETATADNPVEIPVSDDIPAGRIDVPPLKPGTAARIMTGSPVPEGADAIVPVEQTDAATTGAPPATVRIFNAPVPAQHIRRKGEEASAGDVVLPAGTPLTPSAIGLAAAVGHPSLSVYRRPRVLVLSTGSELVPVGEPLKAGQIYESNSHMLAAAIRRTGATAHTLTLVPDEVDSFMSSLQSAAADADLIITSGGVSAGAYEVVKDGLSSTGTVQFDKVGMQPGMPQGAGTVFGTPIVTLPGNPVSVYVSFEVFVRPALLTYMGIDDTERPGFVGTWTGDDQPSPAGKRQFLRGTCDVPAGEVAPIGTPPSHLLASLARSNCLAIVPEATTHLHQGDDVEIWLLDGAL